MSEKCPLLQWPELAYLGGRLVVGDLDSYHVFWDMCSIDVFINILTDVSLE